MADPAVNTLLAALPVRTQAALGVKLRPVSLRYRQVLVEHGDSFKEVYFPLNAVICLMSVVDGHRMVEGMTIGNEGFVGVPVFLGRPYAISDVVCQFPGDCLAIDVKSFTRVISKDHGARAVFAAYTDFVLASTFRNIACMRYHDLASRCARWLLRTQDRTNSHNLPYTQQLLADMLGVTRPRVTTIARELEQAGLIHYQRGSITLADRKGLEKRACSCYDYVNGLRSQQLGILRQPKAEKGRRFR
jgi:CRP-like cAMP-binding protein